MKKKETKNDRDSKYINSLKTPKPILFCTTAEGVDLYMFTHENERFDDKQFEEVTISPASIYLGSLRDKLNKTCTKCKLPLGDNKEICPNCGEQFHYMLDERKTGLIVTEVLNKDIATKNIPQTIDGYYVTTIGKNAFKNCTKLKSIILPDKVTTIGESAFEGCCALESITIPAALIKIDFHAFHLCNNLTKINFAGTKAQWSKIDIINLNCDITYEIICLDGKFKVEID